MGYPLTISYYYPSFCLQPPTILVGQAVSPVIADRDDLACATSIQSRARQQAIVGCGEAALWGGPPGPRPTPWSACSNTGRAGPGGPARTRASAPRFGCGDAAPPLVARILI